MSRGPYGGVLVTEARLLVVDPPREESQRLIGDGDAEADTTYAAASGRDPDLYGFLRRLESDEKIFAEGTTVRLPPDADLLRYFQGPGAS
jgi:modulator of FtsH protease HflC